MEHGRKLQKDFDSILRTNIILSHLNLNHINNNIIIESFLVQPKLNLGFTLYRRLTWSLHLKDKRKELNTSAKATPSLYSNLTIPTKIILYKTLRQRLWEYGTVIWGSAKNYTSFPKHLSELNRWHTLQVHLKLAFKITLNQRKCCSLLKALNAKLQDNPKVPKT